MERSKWMDLSDENGRILDRIAGLEKVIAPELINQALRITDKQPARKCVLTNEVMMWVVLAMGLFTDLPIRQVFKACRRFRRREHSPGRSSLCMARQRLGSEPLVALHKLAVRPLATPDTPGAFYRGLRLVAIDGTVLDAPDCDALQCLGRSKGSRGAAAFPQLRKLSLVELGTHVELAIAHGGWHDSEKKLAPQLWPSIPKDALLIEDRGFFSYKHWQTLENKHKLLVRLQKSMVLEPILKLPDGSYLAKIYPSSAHRRQDCRGIIVRVIEYKLDDPQRTGHGEVHRLITNLLDDEMYPALELVMIYHERWEEEITYDEQQTHQNPRRAEKTADFRSETLDGVVQELYALSLAHFVVRAMMFEAAQQADIDVDRISFKGAFQIIKTRLPECVCNSQESMKEWFDAVTYEISLERIPPRANRINPRVIKRKMSPWRKCREHDRKRDPLTKVFIDTILMRN